MLPLITNCGIVIFMDTSTAGNATFTNGGGTVSGTGGGFTVFQAGSTADNATVISNGATVSDAFKGQNLFEGDAGNATLIANGGSNGGEGGFIQYRLGSTGGTARVEVFGNGTLDISQHNAPGVTTGSIEGSGLVFLGGVNLTVGTNNLSTTFSGVMQDGGFSGGTGGSLTKTGTGKLTLSRASTYTGVTIVNAGTLLVSNTTGSATGPGAVKVNAGTLGGSGTITGAVTIGTGSGAGAFLAPAGGTRKQATLTSQSALTFNGDATYTYTFKAKGNKSRTDKMVALGVTIKAGATFVSQGTVQGALQAGLVLTVISNTSATPISGTFSNLADGAILAVQRKQLPSQLRRRRRQRSYPDCCAVILGADGAGARVAQTAKFTVRSRNVIDVCAPTLAFLLLSNFCGASFTGCVTGCAFPGIELATARK